MLLRSIKLVNFRQFLNEEIAFASGKDGKNVTIILGEMVLARRPLLRLSSGACTEKRNSPTK